MANLGIKKAEAERFRIIKKTANMKYAFRRPLERAGVEKNAIVLAENHRMQR